MRPVNKCIVAFEKWLMKDNECFSPAEMDFSKSVDDLRPNKNMAQSYYAGFMAGRQSTRTDDIPMMPIYKKPPWQKLKV